MKNMFKKLVILTSFASISSTSLYVMGGTALFPETIDLTFKDAATKAIEDKTLLEKAIDGINQANIIDGVLKKNENTLTQEYANIFTNNIKPQEDETIKQTLTLLYVAKIAGAAVSRVTTNLFTSTEALKKTKEILQEEVTIILEAIGYKENKYQFEPFDEKIEIEADAIKIDDMLKTPATMIEQVQKLITSLTDAKDIITREYKAKVKFSAMLNARFGNTSIKDHLEKAAENIERLKDAYFENIKNALITRGESIYLALQAHPKGTQIQTDKEKIAGLFLKIFEDDTTPIDQPGTSDQTTDDNPPPPSTPPSQPETQKPDVKPTQKPTKKPQKTLFQTVATPKNAPYKHKTRNPTEKTKIKSQKTTYEKHKPSPTRSRR